MRVPQGGVNAVAFHRTGSMVALACADGTVRMFDCKDGKERWQKKAHASDALAVALTRRRPASQSEVQDASTSGSARPDKT